jgi:hypothetical protein
VAAGAVASISAIQDSTTASAGMRQSPRGERATEPTFGPSAVQLRFHWLAKKRRKKRSSQRRSSSAV